MAFKVNISHKEKTIKKEIENEELIGKKIGETIDGKEIAPELAGYELEITGTSDTSGFPGKKDVEGQELKRVLLTKGFGLKRKPKGLSKKRKALKPGVRLKKTVRGNIIGNYTVQINAAVKKEGSTKFEDLIPKKEEKKEETPAQ